MPIENPYRSGLSATSSTASNVGAQFISLFYKVYISLVSKHSILLLYLFLDLLAHPINARTCNMYTVFRLCLYVGGLSILVLLAVRKMEHNRAEELFAGAEKTSSVKDHLLLRGVYQERRSEESTKAGTLDRKIPKHLIEKSIVNEPNLSVLRETEGNRVASTVSTNAPTARSTTKPSCSPTIKPTFQPTAAPTSAINEASRSSSSSSSSVAFTRRWKCH